MAVAQLDLWQQSETKVESRHLIEVHYADGKRRILDTSNPADKAAFSDINIIYAGFVPVKERKP